MICNYCGQFHLDERAFIDWGDKQSCSASECFKEAREEHLNEFMKSDNSKRIDYLQNKIYKLDEIRKRKDEEFCRLSDEICKINEEINDIVDIIEELDEGGL